MTVKILNFDTHKHTVAQAELDVLVLACTEHNAAVMEQTLAGMDKVRVTLRRYTGSMPLQDDISDSLADVVILEMDGLRAEILQDIRHFIDKRGHETELFVTLPNADLQMVKRLVQNGVVDIIPQPVNRQELASALAGTRSRQKNAAVKAQSARNAVTAFMRTHANAGGSFTALNVAWQLAAHFHKKTVLVDMDIQFGTVASELDIKSDSSLLEALRNPERIDKVFVETLITRHASGLDVLASPGDLSPSEYLNTKAVSRLISVLADTHEHVIINLPLFVNDAVIQVFRHSNPLFLITQGSMSPLRNLRMLMENLPRHGIDTTQVEVIHLDSAVHDEDVKTGVLQRLVGERPLHLVHHDYKQAIHADNEGKAACELYPRTDLARDIRNIAARIAAADADASTDKKRNLLRWFS